jgi:hypothetical protein
LKTILPTKTSAYYTGVGTRIITEARLTVGGEVVSTLTGPYIDLINNIEVPYENQGGISALTLTGVNRVSGSNYTPFTLTYLDFGIPTIPMCCLERHDVIIEVDLNPTLSSQFTITDLIVSTLLVEYATVGNPELDWFTKSKQTIVYNSLIYRNVTVNAGNNVIHLEGYVKNFVKEFFIILQSPANINTYTYSSTLTNISLTFCGQDLINYPADYFSLIAPFETKIVTPTRAMYMYSFTEPVNFSRISEILLTLTSSSGPLTCTLFFKTHNVFVAMNGLGSFIFA